jgi:LacI family transcriptional regulator
MAATIKDVARHARVSVASVSRTLNNTGVVTTRTRERVLRAARKLRYTPHAGARSLSTRRTQTIGVLLPDIYGEFFSELIRGIDLAARARRLHLLVTSSHGDAEEASAAIRSMSGRVDGLLVMSPHVDAHFLDSELRVDLPTVLMNTRNGSRAFSSFTVDDYGGAYTMTEHLARVGHRHIAHITGPDSNFESRERLRGYRAARTKLRLPGDDLIVPGDFSEESGYRAAATVLALSQRPDAIFAANDIMAIGCLFGLTEAGVKVPSDIALVGFDDIPIARYVTPPLTTVRVDIAHLGQRALERLAATIDEEGRARAVAETVKPELIVRVSCGVGRGNDQ